MKIRNGFVSNSSTSSFAVFGVIIEKFEPFYKKITGKKKTKLPKVMDDDDGEVYELAQQMAAEMEKILKAQGLDLDITVTDGYEEFNPDNAFVIGKDLDSVNETEDPLATIVKARESLHLIMGDMKPKFYHGEIYN